MDAPCALIPMTVEEAALANERFSGNEGMARITHERLVGLHKQLKVKQEADKATSPREHDDGWPTRRQGTQPELDSASTLLTTTTQRYLEFRATFTKTSVLVLWMALMRRMFEELLAIHQELDRVVSLGRLDDPRVATYVDDLKAARSAEEADISDIVRSQTLPFVRNVRGHEAMEALTLMKFEIDYYRPPYNSKTHWESMKTVFFSIVRSSTGRVSKIPDWFTPPYLVTYNKDKVLRASEANAIAKTFRGRYADQKVHRPTTADVIVKLFELEVDGIAPFRREAEQWFKMDSPHVVKLLAASHCSLPALLVVEDVKGVTLKEHLSNPNHFHEIWAKVRQVAEGLAYLRKQRMVHGNLKPSNILVDKNGTAKVGDFGRGIATLQNLAIIAGNGESFMRWRAPEYRSPDQRPTYMSDVYSLGLCILDMLVPNFEPPHDGQLHRPNGIKDDAWSLIAQMCALEPTDRIDLSEVIEKLKLLDKAPVKVLVRNIPSKPDIPGNSIRITPLSSVTICSQIGKGSHAYIHRADWKGAGIVAKCVPIKSVADKQGFDREMSIWSKVQPHPHVLPLYGISESGSQCIAFCEFAASGSLDKYLSNNGRAGIWQKLLQATLGLKHLHTHDVIHNDIKCNNFMVRGDGQVMIADFDLSLILNEPPSQVANLNPRWRAPECIVAGGAGPSFASDVYSLGMCFVEAITGEAPWGSLPEPAIRYHLKKQTPLNRPSTISDAEWELVSAMIKYKPEERITLDDVVQRLQQLADAEEFSSTQTS